VHELELNETSDKVPESELNNFDASPISLLDTMDKILKSEPPQHDTHSSTDFDDDLLLQADLQPVDVDVDGLEGVTHDQLETELDNILSISSTSTLVSKTHTKDTQSSSLKSDAHTMPKLSELKLKSGSPNVVFELSPSQKKELLDFLVPLGLDNPFVDHLAAEAVDLSTMMTWVDPFRELRFLGVNQIGVLTRVTEALKKKGGSKPQFPTVTMANSVYGLGAQDSEVPISKLGELVLQKGEQLLELSRPELHETGTTSLVNKTLSTTVHLTNMEFEFSFSLSHTA